MAARDAMFTIDAALEKMRDCMERVQGAVSALRDDSNAREQSYAKHVDCNDKTLRMMATYLGSVGRFRGESPESIIEWFRSQALTPKKASDGSGEEEGEHDQAIPVAESRDAGGVVQGEVDA